MLFDFRSLNKYPLQYRSSTWWFISSKNGKKMIVELITEIFYIDSIL